MGQSQNNLSKNGRNEQERTYPELVMAHKASEQDVAYYAALELVANIDEALTRGTRHYRNKAGDLLTTLDEVIHAILDNDLQLPESREEREMFWLTPQELAA